MKNKYVLKAGILLAMLLLVLPVSVESVKADLQIDSIKGGPGVTTTVSTTSVEENVTITCSVKGGFLPFGRSWTTASVRIDPGNPWSVRGFFWGFGNNLHITVTAKSLDSGDTVELTAGPEHIFLFFTW